ncbi:MAG TPA: bifunctional serine/threonine-protein kinase/formylglycine-generating enzyme family protein [Vicinamibacterales bacterium]|nr:bifunctional serine/threonine-protein kinase/formylglycine-generating enzyme family protein [Vicinamibacterales bacterium]
MNPVTPGLQLGRYVIRAKLGSGGMADVFLADDLQLGRRVALKFLPPETEADPLARRRLLREARAAATLDHPHICSIYEVGEADGRQYIAMQYVEGETLDARLRLSPLDLNEILASAVQIVDALSEAHAHGILHRDIKPANIMVTTRGDAKVMDFGLAKHDPAGAASTGGTETVSMLSHRGDIVGTVSYMSPEQARGEPLDPRSDLFSAGVLLYEMVCGQRPFQGASSAAVAAAILTHEPLPLARFAPRTPTELERIVTKLLKKQPESRYQTAKDLLIDLRALKEEQEFQLRLGRTPPPPVQMTTESGSTPLGVVDRIAPSPGDGVQTHGRSRRTIGLGVAALLVVAAGGWFAWRTANVRWARAQVAQVAALAEAGRYFDAYELAVAVDSHVPGDPTITKVLSTISDTVSVTTEPPGAMVYLKPFTGGEAATASSRRPLGTSPFANVRIARGEYVLSIEKEGYAPVERTVSGVVARVGALTITPPPIRIEQRLLPVSGVPARMVFVPGGDYRLISWSRPTDRRVRLDDYFIDKYEVSNQEYKEFINAGGYVKREFWKHPFVKEGRTIPWDDAMGTLVDQTGLPGPRTWSNQSFSEGRADHPVTDITWYEADAYAAFRGKRLATIFQWEKAARNGYAPPAGVSAMPWGAFYPGNPLKDRANFGTGPLPTTSGEFGMSTFGAYNMAGNVAEWTSNDSSNGFLATGGAWGDPTYAFSQFGGRPGFFSSEKLGFRCARTAIESAGDQGGMRIELDQEVPQYTAPSPEVFATLASSYRYASTPLDARIEQTTETPEWKRERITFNGANGARAIAYLYLPNHAPRPLQVMHYLPAGDVDGGFRSLPDSMDDRMAPFVRGGRAAFGVVLEGYIERLRPASFVRPAVSTVEFAEIVVNRVTDLRRGLDYLETRTDIDMSRMAGLAPSAGSTLGLILGALETRHRAFVFIGAGLPGSYRAINAAANPINFAAHIRAPKLILQGRYDEDTPLRTATEPLFKLLSEPKRLTLYDGGHVPSVEVVMSSTSAWLEEHLGRVVR